MLYLPLFKMSCDHRAHFSFSKLPGDITLEFIAREPAFGASKFPWVVGMTFLWLKSPGKFEGGHKSTMLMSIYKATGKIASPGKLEVSFADFFKRLSQAARFLNTSSIMGDKWS